MTHKVESDPENFTGLTITVIAKPNICIIGLG